MDENSFNMSMRKFLKRVGVTSQQQIEEAVRTGLADGSLTGDSVSARVVLTIAGQEHVVEGEIALHDAPTGTE
ncbi:MAG: DUF6494 family protein, partial [Pseudomonadota bacterium]